MRAVAPVLLALAIAAPATAQTTLTGNWSGNYTYSVQSSACQNKVFSSNGNVAITLLQAGTSVQGRADLTDALFFHGDCNPTKGERTVVITGTLDGSTIVWTFPNDSLSTQFTGTVTGDSITAQISDAAGGTGTLSITRSAPDTMPADFTGAWSGTYNFVDRCTNGATQAYNGSFTLGLMQTGDRASGVATLQNVPLYDSNCRKITALNMAMSVSGAVAGSSLTGAVFEPSGTFEFPITATIDSSGMHGTVSGVNQTATTGTFTITRSNAQAPSADFAGSYEGTYNEADDGSSFCVNIGLLRFSGAVSVSIAQAGNAIAGSVTFHDALTIQSDGFGGCAPVDIGDEVLPLWGQLSNGTLSVVLPVGSVSALFNVTFAGAQIQGTIADSVGDAAAFSATKTVIPTPPPPGPRRHVVRP